MENEQMEPKPKPQKKKRGWPKGKKRLPSQSKPRTQSRDQTFETETVIKEPEKAPERLPNGTLVEIRVDYETPENQSENVAEAPAPIVRHILRFNDTDHWVKAVRLAITKDDNRTIDFNAIKPQPPCVTELKEGGESTAKPIGYLYRNAPVWRMGNWGATENAFDCKWRDDYEVAFSTNAGSMDRIIYEISRLFPELLIYHAYFYEDWSYAEEANFHDGQNTVMHLLDRIEGRYRDIGWVKMLRREMFGKEGNGK